MTFQQALLQGTKLLEEAGIAAPLDQSVGGEAEEKSPPCLRHDADRTPWT